MADELKGGEIVNRDLDQAVIEPSKPWYKRLRQNKGLLLALVSMAQVNNNSKANSLAPASTRPCKSTCAFTY